MNVFHRRRVLGLLAGLAAGLPAAVRAHVPGTPDILHDPVRRIAALCDADPAPHRGRSVITAAEACLNLRPADASEIARSCAAGLPPERAAARVVLQDRIRQDFRAGRWHTCGNTRLSDTELRLIWLRAQA